MVRGSLWRTDILDHARARLPRLERGPDQHDHDSDLSRRRRHRPRLAAEASHRGPPVLAEDAYREDPRKGQRVLHGHGVAYTDGAAGYGPLGLFADGAVLSHDPLRGHGQFRLPAPLLLRALRCHRAPVRGDGPGPLGLPPLLLPPGRDTAAAGLRESAGLSAADLQGPRVRGAYDAARIHFGYRHRGGRVGWAETALWRLRRPRVRGAVGGSELPAGRSVLPAGLLGLRQQLVCGRGGGQYNISWRSSHRAHRHNSGVLGSLRGGRRCQAARPSHREPVLPQAGSGEAAKECAGRVRRGRPEQEGQRSARLGAPGAWREEAAANLHDLPVEAVSPLHDDVRARAPSGRDPRLLLLGHLQRPHLPRHGRPSPSASRLEILPHEHDLRRATRRPHSRDERGHLCFCAALSPHASQLHRYVRAGARAPDYGPPVPVPHAGHRRWEGCQDVPKAHGLLQVAHGDESACDDGRRRRFWQ
mmetsp:Transcript_62046/g.173315  ORF Transcript_62046/g.173315 Transcript_62046/m.173315 type:complete len:475 (-) Transcript_62046:486-1910(-)